MPGLTVGRQVLQFFITCGLGFVLGLYYEFFRTLRLWSPPSVAVCILEDVFFCLSSTMITFFTFLSISDGNLYPYLFAGEIVGFFVFYGSLGTFVHKVLLCLLRFYVKTLKRVGWPFCRWVGDVFTKLKHRLVKKQKKTEKTQKKSIFFSKKP